ncbi:MAG: hypothetical protein MEQ84_00240 [Mesorhizobium sp.]|nr:hypothetical protein [Mesorhizobium sp.]
MLARRFMIVCLITAFFGIGMAMVVAQSSPPAYWLSHQASSGCASAVGMSCAPPRSWHETPFR